MPALILAAPVLAVAAYRAEPDYRFEVISLSITWLCSSSRAACCPSCSRAPSRPRPSLRRPCQPYPPAPRSPRRHQQDAVDSTGVGISDGMRRTTPGPRSAIGREFRPAPSAGGRLGYAQRPMRAAVAAVPVAVYAGAGSASVLRSAISSAERRVLASAVMAGPFRRWAPLMGCSPAHGRPVINEWSSSGQRRRRRPHCARAGETESRWSDGTYGGLSHDELATVQRTAAIIERALGARGLMLRSGPFR